MVPPCSSGVTWVDIYPPLLILMHPYHGVPSFVDLIGIVNITSTKHIIYYTRSLIEAHKGRDTMIWIHQYQERGVNINSYYTT